MNKLDKIQKEQVSTIFSDAFFHMFNDLKIEKNVFEKIFADAFLEDYFYIAIDNENVLGLIAISNNKTRAVKFDKKLIKKEVGFLKSISLNFILPMLEKPEVKNETDCYIDFVAVNKNFRSTGVGAKLFNHIYQVTSANDYYLEVLSENTKAIKFYKKLSYIDTGKKTSKLLKLIGVPNLYKMKYSRKLVD